MSVIVVTISVVSAYAVQIPLAVFAAVVMIFVWSENQKFGGGDKGQRVYCCVAQTNSS
jgi:hypothetical protein